MHILDPDYIVPQPLVPQYNFDHHAKSRDMTSHRPLVWRAFVLPIFGPKVQAEAKILRALKIAKIKEKMMTFFKLLGLAEKRSIFYRNI